MKAIEVKVTLRDKETEKVFGQVIMVEEDLVHLANCPKMMIEASLSHAGESLLRRIEEEIND